MTWILARTGQVLCLLALLGTALGDWMSRWQMIGYPVLIAALFEAWRLAAGGRRPRARTGVRRTRQ